MVSYKTYISISFYGLNISRRYGILYHQSRTFRILVFWGAIPGIAGFGAASQFKQHSPGDIYAKLVS